MVDLMMLGIYSLLYIFVGLIVSAILVYYSKRREFDFTDVSVCLLWPLAIMLILIISFLVMLMAAGDRIIDFLHGIEEKYRESPTKQ